MNKIWFEKELERTISETIESCYPSRWTENTISEEILKSLLGFFNKNTYYDQLSGLTKIDFSAYKLSGKPETDFGDIALLTTIRFDNGMKLKGVANFEAKKRLKDTINYRGQSRDNQYSHICSKKPYSQLLLYDFEPITQHIKPTFDFEYWEDSHRINHNSFLFAKCTTIPLYLVTNEKQVTRNHLRQSRILTEQLCRRIFYGVDLHYDEKIIQNILDFDNKNPPMFIATVAVTHGNTSITDDNDRFEVPQTLYAQIRQQ